VRVPRTVEFLLGLEQEGVLYTVLRWAENIPTDSLPDGWSKKKIDEVYGDVDILIDVNNREVLLDIALKYQGHGVKIEFYSKAGIKGTSFLGFPYYPPIFAARILNSRKRLDNGVFCTSGLTSLLSFAYHLVYQKALDSGIDSGISGISIKPSNKDYLSEFHRLAAELDLDLGGITTLIQLHEWLISHRWDMPFDLMLRWPKRDTWIEWLTESKRVALKERANASENTIVYVLREDIEGSQLEKRALELIEDKFSIERILDLSPSERESVARRLRGGNWNEGKLLEALYPYKIVICKDFTPLELKDPDVRARYPHVDNANCLYKLDIRTELEKISGKKVFGIHASDNGVEAQYMIECVEELAEK